jgi:lipopolysaccharide transport system ATP-binding protein
MSDPAISIQGVSKLYRLAHLNRRPDTIREAIVGALMAPIRRFRALSEHGGDTEAFWALKDVSFEVARGEVVGIIGRNGAGKSTLLKVLSRIVEPTEGRVVLRGRVASLLEVGTGFHPDLTGRENIFLNGSILGMKHREIRARFDEIVAFADIERFLDTPVKRYSSGMYVRLAFAVAAHLQPDILIVDEVLAVGDAEFQRKCLGKMREVSVGSGRTVLFVSHNMTAVQALCSKAVLLRSGRVHKIGPTASVVEDYLDESRRVAVTDLRTRTRRSGSGVIRLTSARVEDGSGNPRSSVQSGAPAEFVFGYETNGPVRPESVDVGVSLSDSQDQILFVLYSSYMGTHFRTLPPRGEFRCLIPSLPLRDGVYTIGGRIEVGGTEADWPQDGVGELRIDGGDFYGTGSPGFVGARSAFKVRGTWSCLGEPAVARLNGDTR